MIIFIFLVFGKVLGRGYVSYSNLGGAIFFRGSYEGIFVLYFIIGFIVLFFCGILGF